VLVATSPLLFGCVVGGGASGDSSGSSDESSLIDEKLNVSIRCYLAPGEYDVSVDETGMVIPAGAYIDFIEDVTVTNYSQKSQDIYVEYMAYDNNGKAMKSGNWREIVTAGQTLNFPDDSIFQATSEFVINSDGSFNCEVTRANL
jgi:hypothetical protein